MKYKKHLLASSLLLFLASSPVIAEQDSRLLIGDLTGGNGSAQDDSSSTSIDNPRRIAPNDSDTSLMLYNKGGYYAKVEVLYMLNGVKQSAGVSLLPVEQKFSLILPPTAEDVWLTAYSETGLIWAPYKVAFSAALCQYNNQWWDGETNEIEVDIWGTSLSPKGAIQRPEDTFYNGADTSKLCGVQ